MAYKILAIMNRMNNDIIIFKNTAYQILGKIMVSFFGLVATAYLARYLGVRVFGQYNLILTYVGLAFVLADFGLGSLLIRHSASHPEDKKYSSFIYSLRIILSLSVCAVLVMLSFIFPRAINTMAISLVSLGYIFSQTASAIWSYFQGNLQYKKVVIPSIVVSIMSLALILLGIRLELSLAYFLSVFTLSSLSGLVLSLLISPPGQFRFIFNRQEMMTILKTSAPFAAGFIISVMYFKIDTLILSYYFHPEKLPDVGFYSLAYKPFEICVILGSYFTQTLFPFFSQKRDMKIFRQLVKKYFAFSFGISLVVGITLFAGSPLIIRMLGGTAYTHSIIPLRILSLAAFLTILAGFFMSVALSKHKEVQLLKIAGIALILNIALNMYSIPRYSYVGASWATVVTQCFILIGQIYSALQVVRER